MDTKAKDLFDRNPKVDTLYKVKHQLIYFTSKEGAEKHVKGDFQNLNTIKREDFLTEEKREVRDQFPMFPEGDPVDDWKNDEIRAWLDS